MAKVITHEWYDTAQEVENKINEWAEKGYNLPMYFINIVCSDMGDYVVFYDSRLDK